jgi:hypothetical protein
LDLGLTPAESGLITLNAISNVTSTFFEEIQTLQQQDPHLKGVWKEAKRAGGKYQTREGVLYTLSGQLVVPGSMVKTVIGEHHDHSGHFGMKRTYL